MIGLVQPFDPPDRIIDGDALAVDLLGVAHHPRHRAKPACDPHRAGIGEGGQAALEHAGIKLVGFAIDVHVAARKVRPHQRVTALHHAQGELVDERVLGAPQGRDLEPGRREESPRVNATAVRRIEDDRPAPLARFDDLERRIEFVVRFGHVENGWPHLTGTGWMRPQRFCAPLIAGNTILSMGEA